MLPNDRIDPLFQATIDATEEAVVNGIRVFALPGDRVVTAKISIWTQTVAWLLLAGGLLGVIGLL